MENKIPLKHRLARLFQSSTLLRSPCNNSTTSSSIFSSSAAGSASSRFSVSTDIVVDPVFLPRNSPAGNPVFATGKVDRANSLPGRLDCGGCRPTRTNSDIGLIRNIGKCDEKKNDEKKKFERRLRESGTLYETGEREGNTCPPASPSSPKNKYYNRGVEEHKNSIKMKNKNKMKNKKKLLSNGYGFSSSSSEDEGFEYFSTDEEETFFSSRSFSSDSSGFYQSNKKNNQRKKPSRKPPTHRRTPPKDTFQPLVSMTSSKAKTEDRETQPGGKSGFPVTKKSRDPYVDFRDSMVEMIVERQIFGAKGLESLLQSYLSLNSPHHHQVILRAFADISEVLFGH